RAQLEFFRTFDLAEAPLLRVGIVETTGADTEREKPGSNAHHTHNVHPVHPVHPVHNRFMLIDMHHIITDGTSLEILTREFFALNAGENLTPLKLNYRDYAGWQSSRQQQQLMKQQEEYWVEKFSGEIPVLNLPTDYPRPLIQSFEGNTQHFTLNDKETGNLEKIARENKLTLYMTLLSIYTILLSKLSGQEDIIVGTPTEGRQHADLENIIGMFVNTLPIRNYTTGEQTVSAYLDEVKKHTPAAFENQEYQFEDLVDRLSVRRDTGRNPIFDVMLNILNQSEYQKQNTSTSSTSIMSTNPAAVGTSKFDMTLSALDTCESLTFNIEYSTKLFKKKTIKRFITYFKGILRAISDAPHQKIKEIEIITEKEKHQILYEFNDTDAGYPRDKTIHQLFEEQAE
ncbi:MAG: non-ribosomal peptide synthetase, partial [bacterium]|nr:non-ribosomal peptide synthetase [bacterium]